MGRCADDIDRKALWLSWAAQEIFMTPWNKSIWMIPVLIVPAIAGAQDTGQRYELGPRFARQLSLSSLKACVHSLRKKPGIHHSMHSGSIARAASALPMSAVSHPN